MLLYVHRNRRLIRDGSPGRPPRLSHGSWALNDECSRGEEGGLCVRRLGLHARSSPEMICFRFVKMNIGILNNAGNDRFESSGLILGDGCESFRADLGRVSPALS